MVAEKQLPVVTHPRETLHPFQVFLEVKTARYGITAYVWPLKTLKSRSGGEECTLYLKQRE